MKILNLYAGIGGNRKHWGDGHEITAVEYKPEIAAIYQRLFPSDKIVVGDAHEYLLTHYHEFDFIWSSPPCPTHSRINIPNQLSPYRDNTKQIANGGGIKPRYPSMTLYQEIIFLRHFFKGKYCVENVIAYYEPLIAPQELGGHWFWANFVFSQLRVGNRGLGGNISLESLNKRRGFNLKDLEGVDKRLALKNCVEPELGKHILDCAITPNTLL